ncbi:Tim44/TimA family putative adaptor protein [uncultured Sphingomonas sp.]|uniref:Tim44/TimA family putative adaptor protein n=1 Tax=uncultured Sphingomonas sp. TaxID=158754 RepID=UPI00261234D3|nr:Tim44/TimA family putative adaptor protein [uncultured Sphingomonas sp.]
MVGIVLLAMVAAFLALRLYMVLGKRSGHEQSLPKPAEERLATAPSARGLPDQAPEPAVIPDTVIEPAAGIGVRAVIAADSGFDVARFLDGAKAAYRMVLEAYWKGDEEELRWLTDEDVHASFVEAIAARKEAGEVLDNRLVSIEKAVISAAGMDGKMANITVRFDADIAAVTRDTEGRVIAGSLNDAVPTHDVWTFSRNVRDKDPNWILTETSEAA